MIFNLETILESKDLVLFFRIIFPIFDPLISV